jgi:hypothetical protein
MNIKFSINVPNVAHESIDGEVVVINLLNGNYYSLENTGAEIWGLIDQGCSSTTISSMFSAKYTSENINISDEVSRFFTDLEQEKLIVPNAKNDDNSIELEPFTSLDGNPLDFIAPMMNRYSDMQELLLLDPIHDVDAMGWPKVKV